MFGLFKNQADYPKRLNECFALCVRGYLMRGEEVLYGAALTAGVIAAREQRHSMLNYLSATVVDYKKLVAGLTNDERRKLSGEIGEDNLCDKIEERGTLLSASIFHKDWSMVDVGKFKSNLKNKSRIMEKALSKGDINLIHREYPYLRH